MKTLLCKLVGHNNFVLYRNTYNSINLITKFPCKSHWVLVKCSRCGNKETLNEIEGGDANDL